ncbi:hypothetical protein ACFPFV_05535 [Salinicoccus siamensis]|uniref:hypothetical protein n=1 Tax=Salinicoccus siamensis TaxID=381830 RepID=UPI0036113253
MERPRAAAAVGNAPCLLTASFTVSVVSTEKIRISSFIPIPLTKWSIQFPPINHQKSPSGDFGINFFSYSAI